MHRIEKSNAHPPSDFTLLTRSIKILDFEACLPARVLIRCMEIVPGSSFPGRSEPKNIPTMLTHLLTILQQSSAVSVEYSQEGQLSPVSGIIALGVIILMIVAVWKVFTKAGEPGWASLIPFYNIIVYLRIAGKPLWWIILFIIPVVNIIVALFASLGLAKNFGKGTGFGIGLWLLTPIFIIILGFDSSTYQRQSN